MMLKHKFILPENTIYLCGHSLGPLPYSAQVKLQQTIAHWGLSGVKAWNSHNWIELSQTVGAKIASLVGANSNEVTVCDSTSVNLYKALKCALNINRTRHVILSTTDIFPADLYVAQGVVAFDPNIALKMVSISELENNLTSDIAVLILSHVNYRDASVLNLKKITQMAHDKGILVIWDLSHSVGILAIDLNDLKVDFAVGCTYKYLNGGPGAPAFIYVNAKHHACSKSPIYGWMGHESPFKFKSSYKAKNNIAKFLGGTPCVLSLAALEGALEVYDHLETNILFQLREEYSTILINLLKQENLTVLTPSLANQKGGHVAFLHPHAYALSQALLDNNIIVDYREPDLIRMCINPLYINLTDLQIALTILKSLLSKQHYLQPKFKLMNKVT